MIFTGMAFLAGVAGFALGLVADAPAVAAVAGVFSGVVAGLGVKQLLEWKDERDDIRAGILHGRRSLPSGFTVDIDGRAYRYDAVLQDWFEVPA